MIGIILLIGIVKKNAIMMIDFALAAERNEGMNSRDAIYQACLLRFRPIMMTTMCALLGGMPMALGWGAGAELRKPLGIAIVGGLVVSQMLTLFTTPVIYLYLRPAAQAFRPAAAELPAPSRFSGSRRTRGEWRLMTRSWKFAVLGFSSLFGLHDRPAIPAARGADAAGPQGNGRQRPVEDGDPQRRPDQGQVVGDLWRSATEPAGRIGQRQ